MQQLYVVFYKQHGIRRIQSLISPNYQPLVNLPRSAMLHYLSEDETHLDIDVSKPHFANYNKRIMVDYTEELTAFLGNPKRNSIQIRPLIRPFFAANKSFKYMKDAAKIIKDPLTLVVCNYSYLYKLYRYSTMPMTEYNKWRNIQSTIWTNIGKDASESDREHFVFLDVPQMLPGYSLLKIYSAKTNMSMLRVFDTHDKLMLLEIWKWIDPDIRSSSIFSTIPDNQLSKVNIVFTNRDNMSIVLNLAYLNSWIKDMGNDTEFTNVTQYPPIQIQKLFLKFMMSMQSPIAPEEIPEEVAETPTEPIDDIDADEELDTDEDVDIAASPIVKQDKAVTYSAIDHSSAMTDDATLDDITKHIADIDTDIGVLDKVSIKQLKDKGIHLDDKGEVYVPEVEEVVVSREEIESEVYTSKSTEDMLKQQVSEYAEYGLLSASDYKKYMADIEAYKKMPSPYNPNVTVMEDKVITPEALAIDPEKSKIPVSRIVQDTSMAASSLRSFDSDYITKNMHKDMLAMVDTIQKAGVVIRKHDIEVDNSVLGDTYIHTIEFKPVDGMPSTLRIKVPKVDPDGTFSSMGSKYRMRIQRCDVPLRKISPNEVALTTYYGKSFVNRSEKVADSSTAWLLKKISASELDEIKHITKITPGMVFDNDFKAPFIYSTMANNFRSIKAGNYTLVFDHKERAKLLDEKTLAKLEVNDARVVGYTNTQVPIVVDMSGQFYANGQSIGTIFDILHLDPREAPVDFVTYKLFSKQIPVVLMLGYSIGIKKLLKLLNATYRIVPPRKTKDLARDEYSISFKDGSYIFSRKNIVASLILGGLAEYEKELKSVEFSELNSKDVYFNLLASKGMGSLYIREMDLQQQLFVDSITKGILEDMKEPTTLNGLLIRATEMLQVSYHPDSQDTKFMRFRGYERISGAVYKDMVGAIRQYRNRNIAGKSKIDMSPYQVWNTIMKDSSMKLIEDINPVQNLKESEIVTYSGEGGRGKNSMNKASRAYHVNDMGTVSEATVDSSDVGVNAYLSANPNLKNQRGLINDNPVMDPANISSTTALLSPASDRDDPKRTGFASIQASHVIAALNYHPPQLRTGYESVIANRTTDMFAYIAKQDGKVIAKTDTGLIVEYKDGTKKGITIGRVFGKAEGSVYPHDIVSDVDVGDKFTNGTVLSHNAGFFQKDFLDPTSVVMKNSMTIKTALYEANQTNEDSCSISKKFSELLTARTTKIKSYTVNFTQNLVKVAKVGTAINPRDILMIIEDEITSTSDVFDDESLLVLKRLANQAPRAGYLGTIDKIEVFYHGDKSDMTDSLRELANKSDKALAEICKSSGKPTVTGQVDDDYRVSGTPLTLDKAEIRFYITLETPSAIGDKVIFASQMKSVIGEVNEQPMTTETGEVIDAVFGFRSIMARVVTSPMIQGTTITLLNVIAKKAVEIYKST